MTARRQERNGGRRGIAVIGLAAAALMWLGPHSALRAATTERVVADRFTGLAIGGIDPVAYFTEGRVTAGRPDLLFSEAGVFLRFEYRGNRAFFVSRQDF